MKELETCFYTFCDRKYEKAKNKVPRSCQLVNLANDFKTLSVYLSRGSLELDMVFSLSSVFLIIFS